MSDRKDLSTEKSYHHGDLKDALVKSAREILNNKGADALSLRAIAADVGVSHMAPYSHFKNKKSLFQSIAATGFKELSQVMIESSESIDKPSELILQYGATYIEFALTQPQLYRLMLGQIENTGRRHRGESSPSDTHEGLDISFERPVLPAELADSSRKPFELLAQAFEQITDDEQQAKAQAVGAWSMVHGMAALLIEGHFSIPNGMSVKEFLAMTAVQTPR